MHLQVATIDEQYVVFDTPDGFDQARTDGFFFVSQPADLDLDAGDRFARGFYRDKQAGTFDSEYVGYRDCTSDRVGARQGYFRRDDDQTEQFFLERRNWNEIFPEKLTQQAESMRRISVTILRHVLRELGIPQRIWDQATGGAVVDGGSYHLTFNHFRPDVAARGLNVHKDSGWVTLLRSTTGGLEVRTGDGWQDVMPKSGHLIVNFGCAMEILTRSTDRPVAAVAHRVKQQSPSMGLDTPDRVSYGLFVDSRLDRGDTSRLYEYSGGQLVDRGSPADFVDDIVERTYETEGVGLY